MCACVWRLLELISSDAVSTKLKVEAVVIVGSLAKGPEHVVQCVFDSGVLPLLLKGTVALLNVFVTKPLARLLEPLRIATILNIYLSNGM